MLLFDAPPEKQSLPEEQHKADILLFPDLWTIDQKNPRVK